MSIEAKRKKSRWRSILHIFGWILHPAIACFELPMRAGRPDVEMSIWLWFNDPNRPRGRACAMCYIANAGCKIGILGFAPAMLVFASIFLFGGVGFGLVTLGMCALYGLAAAAIGLIGAGLVSIVAMVYAFRKGIRLWVDESPDVEWAKRNWPPVRSKENTTAAFIIFPILLLFMVGVMVVPEDWMYHAAACLSIFVPPALWIAHKTCARSIEDCYGTEPLPQE